MEFCLFGETKICLACGCTKFWRRYRPASNAGDNYLEVNVIPEHIRAECQECGWSRREMLKGAA